MRLREAARLYATSCRARGYSEKTVEWHDLAIERLLKFSGEIAVKEFNRHLVESFVVHLQQEGGQRGNLSRHTINSYTRALRAFSHFLEEEEITRSWSLQKLRPPKTDQKLKPVLSSKEIGLVFAALGPPNRFLRARNTCLVALLLDCGLRRAEALGLKMGDVDRQSGVLKVMGKGRRQRLVGVGPQSLYFLERYLRFHPGGEQVFVDAQGHPLSASAVTSMFARLRKRTGLTRFHPHLLRHSSATLRLAAGEDLITLQRQLGHSSLSVTQGYIGSLPERDLAEHRRTSPLQPAATKARSNKRSRS